LLLGVIHNHQFFLKTVAFVFSSAAIMCCTLLHLLPFNMVNKDQYKFSANDWCEAKLHEWIAIRAYVTMANTYQY